MSIGIYKTEIYYAHTSLKSLKIYFHRFEIYFAKRQNEASAPCYNYYYPFTVQQFISEEEKKGIPRNRIIVGGFSQGGAVALYSSLTVAKPALAGIMGLSTWLPLHKHFPKVSLFSREGLVFMNCYARFIMEKHTGKYYIIMIRNTEEAL